jgi:hypothetical protein
LKIEATGLTGMKNRYERYSLTNRKSSPKMDFLLPRKDLMIFRIKNFHSSPRNQFRAKIETGGFGKE